MSGLELVRLALSRLRSSRLRAALTMLGVVIGVASVVALVSVGRGTTADITARLSSLGTNLLTVNAAGRNGPSSTLTLDDARAIAGIPTVAAVAPAVQTGATVAAGVTTTSTSVIGTTADFASVRAYDVWQGSFLTDVSVERALRVAVLGATVADNLGLDATSIGSEVSIDGIPFVVVGILQPKGGAGFDDPDNQVVVPIAAVQKYFVGGDAVGTIGVSATSEATIQATKDAITELLRTRHGLSATADDDFSIFDQSQLLEAATSISGTLTLLLAGIASISLVVGGIGIMNIMLVSVRERTREIGIRKALGARGRDILSQFLIEALTLSLLGGLIGVAVGVIVSAGIGRIAGWGFIFDPTTVAMATAFSLVVGVVFGVWPARVAARLDPIAALRYE